MSGTHFSSSFLFVLMLGSYLMAATSQPAMAVEKEVENAVAEKIVKTKVVTDKAVAKGYTLIHDKYSDYCIRYEVLSPASVRKAAQDLQYYLRLATDVQLKIVFKEDESCRAYIHLGASYVAANAGITDKALADESYRLVTREGDIFIVGKDTSDDAHTLLGGTSNGTRNGVSTFLEDYVGVRWLMPGEVGEDVLPQSEIIIPELNRYEVPGFENRRIAYIQNDNPLVQQWLQRQKQGYSLQLNHYHNFLQMIPAKEYDKHPDWFPEMEGERPRPVGRYKLETTNQELLQAVASRVDEAFKKDKSLYSFSISPSDSGGWSTSRESLALYDRDPHGRQSITPLVLDFYSKVADLVGKTHDERLVCGYIYTNYLYPPSNGIPHLPNNLCLVLAPDISYGYGLYREKTRKDLDLLLQQWSKATPQVAYYDLPVNLLQTVGAPNPPGVEILTYLYPKIAGAGMRGVYMYGVSAWGHGALTNYLLAKLNWNPQANIKEITRDYFLRAYGEEAGYLMHEIYSLLDSANKEFHLQNERAGYRLTPSLLKAVYLPVLGDIQGKFTKAQGLVKTHKQHLRLWMFQGNMNHFYTYLQDAGMVALDKDSVFGDKMLNTNQPTNSSLTGLELSLAPVSDEDESPYKLRLRLMVDKVKKLFDDWSSSKTHDERYSPVITIIETAAMLRGHSLLALYPAQDGEVDITFNKVVDFGESVRYHLLDNKGLTLQKGDVIEGQTLRKYMKNKNVYYLDIVSKQAIVRPVVTGAEMALASQQKTDGLHLFGAIGTLEFMVPKNVTNFSVSLHTESKHENAAADIYAPEGQLVASLDTNAHMSSNIVVKVTGESLGIWKLVGKDSIAGVADDVWLQLDNRLTPWVIARSDNTIDTVIGK
ncbi:MAG: DUF4838 domain-containing protein [Gammaproteobacteria bacterium]|nr:DUF4838 domain-containing protein [Gammaproteobacteria bacterium]